MGEIGVRFGKALQLTNVLRDVPKDLRIGRCYLPLDELTAAGVKPEDVELIVVGTISPDYPFPSCAAVVQGRLGNKKAFAFDVSAAVIAGSVDR